MTLRSIRHLPVRLVALLIVVASGLVALPARAVAPPVVTGVAALSGSTAGGEFVTLHGTGFNGAYVVAFGGVRTRSLHVWSSTEITVRVPAHARGRVFVRVARPGAASASSGRATYSYVATPRGLVPSGEVKPAPPVAAFQFDVIQPNLTVDCVAATFCAAVGGLGASTWDGTAWSAVTPTGNGNETVLLSCSSSTFCLAYSADGHTWRYSAGTWTDRGAFAGLTSLDCGGPTLCGGRVDDQAWLYDGTGWGSDATLFDGGVAGLACPSATTCIANASTGYYRLWTGSWQPARPMWNSVALRRSAATRGVSDHLECATPTYCVSSGERFEDVSHFRMSIFTGSTWSLRQEIFATTDPVLHDVECVSSSWCLHRSVGRDFLGDGFREWRVVDGTAASTPAASSRANGQYAISCWAAGACLGFGLGTWTLVGG